MRKNYSPTDLCAGVDDLSLDKRNFDPSNGDIEDLCRFFSIGKLRHYIKEKDICVSHSNFFVFVATTRGEYALKFYPATAARTIAIEYAVNRILTRHHFPTPAMCAGHNGKSFFLSNDRLATCFSYMDGRPAWQHIKKQKTIRHINTTLFSLKNILSNNKGHIPFEKQPSLLSMASALTRTSRLTAPYDRKEMIDASLLDACRTFRHHQALFTRRWLHNNANLTNFLVFKENIYTLDLSHVREDYVLSDLASLVISCLFFNIPLTTIKIIVKDYFTRHKMTPEYFPVLSTLVKMGLIHEYLKNTRREKSVKISAYPQDLVRTYLAQLSKRKGSIAAVLKKMNAKPGFIF